jgi:molecular chaperone DnaK (HSP70)
MALRQWFKRLRAPRTKQWIGCIDFGTTYSKVAMVASVDRDELFPDDDIRPLPIGRGNSRNMYLLQSLIFVNDEAVLFGHQAEVAARRGERSGREAFESPKQYLSTHAPHEINEKLESTIDPTQAYTARRLLTLYLAHLIKRSELAAAEYRLEWPPKLRIARPSWEDERAAWGEKMLRDLVKDAFVLVDDLEDKLTTPGGVSHVDVEKAFRKLSEAPQVDDSDVFHLSDSGQATVLEATAVAAISIKPSGRRVVVVADIGGGTSDFAAFMTGLPGKNVVAEIKASAAVLRQAGDHLDMLLCGFIMSKAGLIPGDKAARGAELQIREFQRDYKETLFGNKRAVIVEVNDVFIEVTQEEFLDSAHVREFTKNLRKMFSVALDEAIVAAKVFSENGPQVPIEIMLTGGGYDLPMVQELAADPDRAWAFKSVAPELLLKVRKQNSEEFADVQRQLTVSIGGAVKDLPKQTAPIRDAS